MITWLMLMKCWWIYGCADYMFCWVCYLERISSLLNLKQLKDAKFFLESVSSSKLASYLTKNHHFIKETHPYNNALIQFDLNIELSCYLIKFSFWVQRNSVKYRRITIKSSFTYLATIQITYLLSNALLCMVQIRI